MKKNYENNSMNLSYEIDEQYNVLRDNRHSHFSSNLRWVVTVSLYRRLLSKLK